MLYPSSPTSPPHCPPAREEIARGGIGPWIEHATSRMQAGAPATFVVLNELAAATTLFRWVSALTRHFEEEGDVVLDEPVLSDRRPGVPASGLLPLTPILLPILAVPHRRRVAARAPLRDRLGGCTLRNGFAIPDSDFRCLSETGCIA